MLAPRKVYAIDTGLINTISFRSSENHGRLMENLVFIELMRRKSYSFSDFEIYYWKDHAGKEVDFLIKDGKSVKELIQVTYSFSEEDVERREKEALLRASDELRCKKLSIITWDYEGKEDVDGKTIRYIPLWKWILG
jgi:predicted AAA+ superfamily ATPase